MGKLFFFFEPALNSKISKNMLCKVEERRFLGMIKVFTSLLKLRAVFLCACVLVCLCVLTANAFNLNRAINKLWRSWQENHLCGSFGGQKVGYWQ